MLVLKVNGKKPDKMLCSHLKKKREKLSELGKKTKTHKYSCIINLQIKTNLYWIQTHKRFKRTLFIGTKTQICKFWGESPLFLEQKQSVLFQIFFKFVLDVYQLKN